MSQWRKDDKEKEKKKQKEFKERDEKEADELFRQSGLSQISTKKS